MNWKPKHPAFQTLLQAISQEISPAYVVGGAVRDHLLGRDDRIVDIDVAVPHSANPVARRVADRLGWAYYPLDEARDVARLVFTAASKPLVCDVARLRGGEIAADLLSRDFTVNALACVLEHGRAAALIDVCGGVDDLARRILRRVSAASLADDPIRMVRAVRMALDFGLALDEETREQILRMPSAIILTSPERLRDELWKLLASDSASRAIEELRLLGVLPYLLPEVAAMVGVEQSPPHHLDVYEHTLLTMSNMGWLAAWLRGESVVADNLAKTMCLEALTPWKFDLRQHFSPTIASGHSRADWLMWYALFHDVGKPEARQVEKQPTGALRYRFFEHEVRSAQMTNQRLSMLRFSRQEIDLATAVVRHHMRPHLLDASFRNAPISRRACYRFFRDVGGKQVDQPPGIDVAILALADYLSIHRESPPPAWQEYLAHVGDLLRFVLTEKGLERARLTPLVDGYLLMKHFSLAPGPLVGRLLEQIAEAQAAGEINSEREAIGYAGELLAAASSAEDAHMPHFEQSTNLILN
jgi:tRNA nucleotidyltransferase/poly(A) polymerase